MAKKTIWVNTIVHNEENFIWFALMSVIDYVDKILVWDTGSTDKTVEIIREVKKNWGERIEFKEVGVVDKYEITKTRQAMLEQSDCDWILILDGDEIWWENSIKRLVQAINSRGRKIEGIVVPMIVPVGDMYHFQESSAGRYELLGKKGHLNLRAINKGIPGLHVDKPYPLEGYFDNDNKLIQARKRIIFLDAPYLHATHLKRSSKVRPYNKFKYEIGKRFPSNFKYPEVFLIPKPAIVPSPFQKLSSKNHFLANIITPIRRVKRKFKL